MAWLGTGFYAIVTVAIVWRGLSRVVTGGFFAASGVHAALLVLLVREQLFCAACVTAGGAALLGAIFSLATRPRAWLPAAALLTAGAATWCGILMVHPFRVQNELPPAIQTAASRPASTNAGRVKLLVYERDGCKHCVDFEENVLPQLQQALGDTLEVQRLDATIAMETPTIVVEGKTSRTFVGMVDEQTLEEAVRDSN